MRNYCNQGFVFSSRYVWPEINHFFQEDMSGSRPIGVWKTKNNIVRESPGHESVKRATESLSLPFWSPFSQAFCPRVPDTRTTTIWEGDERKWKWGAETIQFGTRHRRRRRRRRRRRNSGSETEDITTYTKKHTIGLYWKIGIRVESKGQKNAKLRTAKKDVNKTAPVVNRPFCQSFSNKLNRKQIFFLPRQKNFSPAPSIERSFWQAGESELSRDFEVESTCPPSFCSLRMPWTRPTRQLTAGQLMTNQLISRGRKWSSTRRGARLTCRPFPWRTSSSWSSCSGCGSIPSRSSSGHGQRCTMSKGEVRLWSNCSSLQFGLIFWQLELAS